METRPNIFIHIGAYKTGTTFLQRNIFPFWQNMVYMNDLWFSYLALIDEACKYIISNETLFGRPWARNNNLSWTGERWLIIKALGRLFPGAQILLSVRNHSDFILSLYKQYLHEGGVLKLDEFFDIDENLGIIKRDDIKYMDTIKLLQGSFDRKPFVFTLEEMKDDLKKLLQKFEKLFGEKAPTVSQIGRNMPNVGVKYWQAKILRILNIIDKKPWSYIKTSGLLQLTNNFSLKHRLDPRSLCQERLRGLSRKPISFDKDYKERVDSYYALDWSRTSEFIITQ